MAFRPLSALSLLAALGVVTLTGCQSARPSAAYVEPTFGPPRLAAARPVPPPQFAPLPTVTRYPTTVIRPPAIVARGAARPPTALAAAVPAGWVPPVRPRPWRYIVIHHSDTNTGGAAAFDRMHRAKGWDELGYDFVIGNGTDTPDGAVEVGPRWTQQKIGAHAKTPDNRFNEYGVGICLVGNMMDHPPTARQMAAVERLSGYLMATYHIPPGNLLGHGDTKNTACPGRYTDLALIRSVAARQAGLPAFAARPPAELLAVIHHRR